MMETQMGFMAMPGVGFFGLLLIGIIAGYVAERAMKRDHGLLTNMIVGIAGSFVGGALAGVLNINYYGFAGNLVVAVVGAILILWIFSRSKRG
ncbi:putative membrane protein [Hoeflea phototrophica DFL-43]|uniref:Putative membrane protein n=1 Tax=Hoeflea phototrophica (strain DSM 17068 / NCIMB 14078 / DFL-43) TaxID=411684 RepID=A9D8T2_HOEPD|nr:putative membrane protein [Hoeflea phototrophica DFL-43]